MSLTWGCQQLVRSAVVHQNNNNNNNQFDLRTSSDNQLFCFFSYVFMWFSINDSSLFISMSKFNFKINRHFMDMKKHMFTCFSYPCWWIGKKSNQTLTKRSLTKKWLELGCWFDSLSFSPGGIT
jgi:hypothetical protein